MDNLPVDYHVSQLEQLCQNNTELKSLICVVKNLTDVMKIDYARSKLTEAHWNSIIKIADIVERILLKSNLEDDELDFLAELLRFLRNSCAGSVSNQDFILNSNEILCWGKKIISNFKEKKSDKELIVLKCCLQLFGNLVCSSVQAKSLVWNIFLEEYFFKYLFNHHDSTVKEYAMMVLYNCMSDEAAIYLITSGDGHHIITALVDSLCNDLVDWGILFLEFILKQEDFMKNFYETLPLQSRLLILDVIIEQISSTPENVNFFVPYSSLNYIKNIFIQFVLNIVQICSNETADMKPAEIVKILGLLCAASVSDSYSHVLKSSQELLEVSLDTLKSVHLLGKKSTNSFSCISNLKATDLSTKEEIELNPSYGFKKNLLRKLDGIPLLLDCCNLDARNPFIMQWCILAIRNILEKNSENQAVLAGISVSGDLVDSALIKELGFEVASENGKFVLKSIHAQNLL